MSDYTTNDYWEEDTLPLKNTALDRQITYDRTEVDKEWQRLRSKLADTLV